MQGDSMRTILRVSKKTLVTSDVEMVVKGGLFGRLLQPFMYLALRLGLPNGLAPLKYYVETGKPFKPNFTLIFDARH